MPFVLLRGAAKVVRSEESEREETRRVSKLTAVSVSLSRGGGPSFVSLRGL